MQIKVDSTAGHVYQQVLQEGSGAGGAQVDPLCHMGSLLQEGGVNRAQHAGLYHYPVPLQ